MTVEQWLGEGRYCKGQQAVHWLTVPEDVVPIVDRRGKSGWACRVCKRLQNSRLTRQKRFTPRDSPLMRPITWWDEMDRLQRMQEAIDLNDRGLHIPPQVWSFRKTDMNGWGQTCAAGHSLSDPRNVYLEVVERGKPGFMGFKRLYLGRRCRACRAETMRRLRERGARRPTPELLTNAA